MNVPLGLDSANRGSQKPPSRSPNGCGLDCKEEFFGNLADHSQFCLLPTLCEGVETDPRIVTSTSLSQRDVSFHLERLMNCSCVKAEDAEDWVLILPDLSLQ